MGVIKESVGTKRDGALFHCRKIAVSTSQLLCTILIPTAQNSPNGLEKGPKGARREPERKGVVLFIRIHLWGHKVKTFF